MSFDVLADTNDSTPIITGTGVPGEIVYLSADVDNSGTAETTLGIALVGSGGAWAIASTTPLPEGTIALSAYATDSVGNRSDEISSTITTDYTAPSAPLFHSLAPTNNASPTISGTGEVGATVQLLLILRLVEQQPRRLALLLSLPTAPGQSFQPRHFLQPTLQHRLTLLGTKVGPTLMRLLLT